MNLLVFVALAVAGGLGAASRLFLDGIVRSKTKNWLPWGTILINLVGSFLLGLVVGLVSAGLISGQVQLIVGSGFLGGFTTFSTASFETVRLAQERRYLAGAINALAVLVLSIGLAALGLWIGSAI